MVSGHTQVSIFFVLSGFVLSWGPLASIRSGQDTKLAQSLSSATFRRWIRLYFPCFAVSLWECLEIQFGLREMPGKMDPRNIFARLYDWLQDCEHFSNPFLINRDQYNALHGYDWTMWTIPYEFSGSLLVFMTLLGVCRIRNFGKRSLVMLAIVVWALCRAEWYFLLFSTGVLLANYVKQRGGFQKLSETTSMRATVIWSILLVFSMYLGGLPEPHDGGYTRPGYEWTVAVTPYRWSRIEGGGRLWWCIAGMLFVTSSCHLSGVRRMFNTSFVRYLGRVSYMLYLTHRIVLNLFGTPYIRTVMGIFGRSIFIDGIVPEEASTLDGPFTLLLYVLIMGALIPSALIVAHWAEVLIDGPSTRFARQVDDWFTKDSVRTPGQTDAAILPAHSGHTETREEGVALLATPLNDYSEPSRDAAHEMAEIDPNKREEGNGHIV